MDHVATRPNRETVVQWQHALTRAKATGIQAFKVTKDGAYAVTSATDPTVAYLTNGTKCTCAAGRFGDAVCIHRALVRSMAPQPEPEPPAHRPYDPLIESLEWAQNDLERAHRDLDRYNRKLVDYGALNEREYQGFLYAQQREQDASDRIRTFTAQLAGNASVAA